MTRDSCDALVLFGVTGDLAGKMLLPAVHALIARHALDVPVIGVARDGAGEPIAQRVRDNVEQEGALDAAASERLAARLTYVEGDFANPATFAELRRVLGDAKRPLFYLAIPPSLFAGVAQRVAGSGLAAHARIAVEKPFGHDERSAHALDRALRAAFPDDAVFRMDHYLGKWPVRAITRWRGANPWLEQSWSGNFVKSVQITMAESFGVEARGPFYDAVGALRDVVQNHLLQVVAILAMELPDRAADGDAWQQARVAALQAVQPLAPDAIVRGQYDGYRDIEGVRADSQTETFVALRFDIDTPRWRGVPFCVRAGKRLPLTATHAFARYLPPAGSGCASHVRLGLGPGRVDIGVGLGVPDRDCDAGPPELELDCGRDEDRDAYVTLLEALMRGERTYTETAEGIAAAWRAVEPALRERAPVHRYAPGSWGPEAAQRVLPAGERWHDPAAR
jgi:glucose-6-phosphate 1-dehydrogenase